MSSFLELFTYIANITIPIFFIVFLGTGLKRINWINDNFINVGSKLVFTIGLPALLFINIYASDLDAVLNAHQLGYGLVATFAGFLGLWWFSSKKKIAAEDRGVFVQGAFRGNLGIIGLALCANTYGEEGLAIGSILLAFMTLLYNVLSVYALIAAHHIDEGTLMTRLKTAFIGVLKNPLIIAILLGIAANLSNLPIPKTILTSAEYLANMTLPLALLCVGATISIESFRQSKSLAVEATGWKLVILPMLFTLIGYVSGLEGALLGTLFLMFASPTATVSFVMAKTMKGNGELAATIVALSTGLSILSISIGLFILKWMQIV